MLKIFNTEDRPKHNRFDVYSNRGKLYLGCKHVEGDVHYTLPMVKISEEEYEELSKAHHYGKDFRLRDVAARIFSEKD